MWLQENCTKLIMRYFNKLVLLIFLQIGIINNSFTQLPHLVIKNGHEGTVQQLLMNEDNSSLISRDDKNHVVIWDFESGAEINSFDLPQGCIGISLIGNHLLEVFSDGKIEKLSLPHLVADGSVKAESSIDEFYYSEQHLIVKHGSALSKIDVNLELITFDTNLEKKSRVQIFQDVVVVTNNKTVEIHRLSKEEKVITTEIKDSRSVREIVHIDKNDNVIFIDKMGQLVKFNPVDKKQKSYFFELPTTRGIESARAISDSLFIVLSKEPMFYLLDHRLKVIGSFGTGYRDLKNLLIVPEKKCFLFSTGSAISQNDIQSGKPIGEFNEQFTELSLVDFSKEGNALIIGGANGMVQYIPLNPMDKEFYIQIPLSRTQKNNGWNIFPSKIISVVENKSVEFEAVKYRVKKGLIEEQVVFNCLWDLSLNHLRMTEINITRFGKKDPMENRTLTGLKSHFYSTSEKQNEKFGFNVKQKSKNILELTGSWSEPLNIAFFSTGKRIYLRGDYYFAQKSVSENVSFVDDHGNSYQVEQFDPYFNRPDIIFDGVSFVDTSLVSLFKKARIKRIKKSGLNNEIPDLSAVPTIEIKRPDAYYVKEESYKFIVNSADSKQLKSMHVLVNNTPLNGTGGKPLTGKSVSQNIEINLAEGLNEIKVFTENSEGIYSRILKFDVYNEIKTEKNLYLVCAGVSAYSNQDFILNYASKDAGDFLEAISDNAVIFDNVYTQLLTDNKFSSNAPDSLKHFLSQTKPSDVVIFYYAGHGVLDNNYEYYLCPPSTDFWKPEQSAVPFEKFESVITSCGSLNRIIILDACHSGEVDKDEVVSENNSDQRDAQNEDLSFRAAGNAPKLGYGNQNIFEFSKSLFVDTRIQNGNLILASSSGLEFSMEGNKWQNGLFTYFVLQGLKTKVADLNGDNRLYLYELIAYVSDQVVESSAGRQNPTLREDNEFVNIRLY